MATTAGDPPRPPLVDPELLFLDQLAAQQRPQATSATRDEPPPIAVGTNEPAMASNQPASRSSTATTTAAAAAAAPAAPAAAPPSEAVASSSSSSSTGPSPRGIHVSSSRKTYICTLCSPPVDFPTSAKKATHTQVVHQARVRVTSDAGLYFYVGRDAVDRAFTCPRIGCSHRTTNTVSFGLHVRHTCRQPWPATAPDPPEADLPRNEQEEAEGNKRKRGGGRGKGKRRKGLADGADSTATAAAGELGLDAPPQALVDRLRTIIDGVLTQGGPGGSAGTAHGLLRRLETSRRTLLARADEALGLGPDRMTSEALHQTKQALLSSPDGVTTRDFARWHIYARLSPRSAGHGQSQTSQDASARPDLNSIASLVLSYLPFAPQTPNAANAALRSSLLTAVTRVEQGQPALAPDSPPLPTVDQLRASLLYHADLVASAHQALASYAPAWSPAPLAQDASPSLSPASPIAGGLPPSASMRTTHSTATAVMGAPVVAGPPPALPSAVVHPNLAPPHPFPSLTPREFRSLALDQPGQPVHSLLPPPPPPPTLPLPNLGFPAASYGLGPSANSSFGFGPGGGGAGQSSAPLQPSLLSHPPLTAASFETPSTAAAAIDPVGQQRRPEPPASSTTAAATTAVGRPLVGGGGGPARSSRRQHERERIAQLYQLAEELAGTVSP